MIENKFDDFSFDKKLKVRIIIAIFIVLFIFLFIILRLWYLQVVEGDNFLEQSLNNKIRISKITAPRGKILSPSGEIIVKNTPSFDLILIPQDTNNVTDSLEKISGLLNLDLNDIKIRVEKNRNRPPFKPILLKKELSWEEMSLVLSKKTDLPGISIDVLPKRYYCFGESISHVIGYLGEISKEELSREPFIGSSLGDIVGKKGIERWGESYLRGINGALKYEVDAFGNRKKILTEIDPVAGCDITITIDPLLQQKAYELLDGRTGSVIAMNPKTGDILIFLSSPGFDPNLFSRGISAEEWGKLLKNPFNPLLNRVIHSQQPPGSVFKVIVALAALEEEILDVKNKFFCSGRFKLGNRIFRCWKKEGHGFMDLKDALIESCDVFFYNLALRLGIDNISKYSKLLGLGEKTGYEFDNERSGLIPCPDEKKKITGVSWQKGETLNVSIGQGDILVTPLQITTAFCAILNQNYIPIPRIVKKIDCIGKEIAFPPEKKRKIDIKEKNICFIKEALKDVVNSPQGTGKGAKLKTIDIGGKTGTAQVVSRLFEEEEEVPRHFMDHAWFISFAPADDPEIVLCILVEHGGGGGAVAAPIAKEIMKTYFKLNY